MLHEACWFGLLVPALVKRYWLIVDLSCHRVVANTETRVRISCLQLFITSLADSLVSFHQVSEL
jgi:hypothetical protein